MTTATIDTAKSKKTVTSRPSKAQGKGRAAQIHSKPTINDNRSKSKIAIRIQDLVVKFGDHAAVDGISIDVNQGELFAFLGPNGAGKSTTINALIGCQRPTTGLVKVGGYRMPYQLDKAKSVFGYVPDTENHIEEFTGRENLKLFADLYDIKNRKAVIDDVLARLELSEAANVAVKNYSKGMKRKLLIAREILHRPSILILDEPTANLDLHSTALVRKMLRELSREGVTVFLTTHDMEEVEEICDRAAILCKGKLIALDSPTRFIAHYAESRVEAQYEIDGHQLRETIDMDNPVQKRHLTELVDRACNLRLKSQDFNFDDVFLKITGQAYS